MNDKIVRLYDYKVIEENKFNSFNDISIFWKRRWLRTLPLYFVVLLAFLRFDYHGRHELFEYPSYFIFMQSFAYKIPEFFELSWSLAIEEHFYLWFPIIFLVLGKNIKRSYIAIILTAFFFICVAYAFRLSQPFFENINDYNQIIRIPVISRLDAIMFGVLLATLKHYWNKCFNSSPYTQV